MIAYPDHTKSITRQLLNPPGTPTLTEVLFMRTPHFSAIPARPSLPTHPFPSLSPSSRRLGSFRNLRFSQETGFRTRLVPGPPLVSGCAFTQRYPLFVWREGTLALFLGLILLALKIDKDTQL